MVGFRAGGESRLDVLALVMLAQTFDGIVDIVLNDDGEHPNQVTLWFEDQEHAQAAQWMLEAAGAEGRDNE